MWRKPNDDQPSSHGLTSPSSTRPPDAAPIAGSRVASPSSAVSSSASSESSASLGRSASRIAAGLKIQGEFSGSSDLYIDGEMQGKIHLADARVSVGPNGRVQADIDAREIVIDGSVQGNLKASEAIRLGGSSRVAGSVLTPRIAIDDGSRFRGKVETVRAGQIRESLPAPTQSSDAEVLQPVTVSARGE
ncbi:MAG TPA: polymer-forming cytoskeletal protein [Candidatus Acidoferrales bacterium]|nr:polymer-forming cytoskeletal protein [Candidatus Acidoferrales bacterium]